MNHFMMKMYVCMRYNAFVMTKRKNSNSLEKKMEPGLDVKRKFKKNATKKDG